MLAPASLPPRDVLASQHVLVVDDHDVVLAHAQREGRLSAGDRVLLGAFGAGFTWGAAVVEWG